MGLPEWSLEKVKNQAKVSMRDSFPVTFGERWLLAKEIFYDFFTRHHVQQLRPMDGAEKLLEEFQKQGCY